MNAQEYYLTDEEFADLLDDIYGDVEIAGITYSTGYALKELDPIAFRCGISDFMRWKCDECGEIFEEEDEAEECCT